MYQVCRGGRGLWKMGHPKVDTHTASHPAGGRPRELPRLASWPPLGLPGLGRLTCRTGSGPGIPRLPATREPGTGLMAFLTLYSWVRLGRPRPPREGVPHCFPVAAGQLSLRCRCFSCAGMLSCIGTSRGVAALTPCTIYLDLPWQQPHFVCPCIQTVNILLCTQKKSAFSSPLHLAGVLF